MPSSNPLGLTGSNQYIFRATVAGGDDGDPLGNAYVQVVGNTGSITATVAWGNGSSQVSLLPTDGTLPLYHMNHPYGFISSIQLLSENADGRAYLAKTKPWGGGNS